MQLSFRFKKSYADMTEVDWKAAERAFDDAAGKEAFEEDFMRQWAEDNGITDYRKWRMEMLMKALDLYEPLDEVAPTKSPEQPRLTAISGYSSVVTKST
jgi:hypothetical protein